MITVTQSISIHTFIWLISFFGIIIGLLWMRNHTQKGYVIPALTYFINVFLYNCAFHATFVLGMDILTHEQLEIWSGVVRLHSLFLLIAYILVQPVRRRFAEKR